MDEVELTPSGLSKRENVLNLNKERMRAVYFCQDESGRWVGTSPLPADPQSQAYYFAKGFRAKPPTETLEVSSESISCPICGFEAKSNFGLQAHLRIKHKKEEKL